MTPSTLPQSRSHKDAEVFTVVDDGPWNSAHGDVVPLAPRVHPRFVGIASDLGPAPPKAQPPPKWPIVRQDWIGTVHDMPYRSVAERRLVDDAARLCRRVDVPRGVGCNLPCGVARRVGGEASRPLQSPQGPGRRAVCGRRRLLGSLRRRRVRLARRNLLRRESCGPDAGAGPASPRRSHLRR